MTTKDILSQLQALGDEKRKKVNTKQGVVGIQHGVKMGDLRKIAKEIKKDHKLAMELWNTEVYEARGIACLIMDVNQFSDEQLDEIVGTIKNDWISDWMNSYVVKHHKGKDGFRQKWMQSANPMVARAGWNLTASLANRKSDQLDYPKVLDQLEKEMPTAPRVVQWTMNFALGYIGINFPEHRERALQLGESIGAFRDYPTAKGCVSPFVPIWVKEMVRREESKK